MSEIYSVDSDALVRVFAAMACGLPAVRRQSGVRRDSCAEIVCK